MELSDNLSLNKAEADDAMQVAQIIADTSEGLLDLALSPLTGSFGFTSVAQCLGWVLLEGKSAFSLEHVRMLRLDDTGKTAGLYFAYPQRAHGELMPEVMQELLPQEVMSMLQSVMPVETQQTASGDRAVSRMYLNTLWVNPELRHLHLGTFLLAAALQQATDLQMSGMVLHCFNDNTAALRLYDSFGFRTVQHCSYPAALALRHPAGGSILQLDFANSRT